MTLNKENIKKRKMKRGELNQGKSSQEQNRSDNIQVKEIGRQICTLIYLK